MALPEALSSFHPAVATWFERRFPDGPTEAQSGGWQSIASGENTLIAAPTGSGKTLAAFLVAIDTCLRSALAGAEHQTSILYVSPLRALTVDIKENLETPLREIGAIAEELGFGAVDIRVAVRNGDTSQAARAALIRDRPEIVVTTPESLYLLLTARRGRELLSTVRTVIVDEIHAVARDKRGSHLALSLERLEQVIRAADAGARLTRIGLSATQRPIETVARLLVGSRDAGEEQPKCHIVDVGHHRPLDLAIELPQDELGAVMTNEQLDEVVTSLAAHIRAHNATLIFVNTRRMAERLAHLLADEFDESAVVAHHGSLSMQRRLSVESRLRAGDLKAVVATASLELGIDVGPIDLVCQLGSPRAIATFLQRVGRAEHRRTGVPKGRIYPMTRDELVECVALFGATRAGKLDALVPPRAPLDILAQQIVAECAASGDVGIGEDELYSLIRRAEPYASLSRADYDEVVALMSDGVVTGRGTRGAHLHRDRVNHVLTARRGARLTAATSGGAIPELADYKVILEPEGALVGTVHEDFAVEAMAGDVFLLGSASWRVQRVETGIVRVVDAEGQAPTIPFWLGEAPARTDELSRAVSDLRRLVSAALDRGGKEEAVRAVREYAGVEHRPADETVTYLEAAHHELGTLPSQEEIVFERFFDDTGGMQLVVHSPFGARINRGFGLALRKRFCRSFDFELQAAANDDAIVLSLGPQHSFALDEATRYLTPATVQEVLTQAVLPTPIFASRWRWNLSRSLISPRFRGARHLPPAIQRMEADDLMAAIFPQLAACQENVTGPIEIPNHPIVRQTLTDCCTEAMDLAGLIELVGAIRSGEIAVRCVDTIEASVLGHEILNGRPYTFLDDAPLEERRTRAVSLRRGIPIESRDLSNLDEAVIAEIGAEIALDARSADELHDALLSTVVLEPHESYERLFGELVAKRRAALVHVDDDDRTFWCATERRGAVETLFEGARFDPDVRFEEASRDARARVEVLADALRGHLALSVPLTASEIAKRLSLVVADVASALVLLEGQGQVLQVPGGRWAAKSIVQRIHARQRDRERSRWRAVSIDELIGFYVEWHHVGPGSRRLSLDGLRATIDQLQGLEAAVGSWEDAILPARVSGYHAAMLDELALQGEVTWGRLSLRASMNNEHKRGGRTPSRATPVSLVRREDLAWLIAASRLEEQPTLPPPGAAREVIEALSERGALFFADLCSMTGRMPIEVAEALWDGVTRGLVTSDGFQAMRALLSGRYRTTAPSIRPEVRRGPRLSARRSVPGRSHVSPALAGGRWSLLSGASPSDFEPDELADAVAMQLLQRWGVVLREIYPRESFALAWRDVLWALRRLEARGIARGGRFVAGPVGEQFALPEALDRLRQRGDRDRHKVVLGATDPLNLTGLLLPGPRIPALLNRQVTLDDFFEESELRGSNAS
jgi:ATP-dependent Lhr-like helicase